jgi:hypothetical protein
MLLVSSSRFAYVEMSLLMSSLKSLYNAFCYGFFVNSMLQNVVSLYLH